jgi:betaine reductase
MIKVMHVVNQFFAGVGGEEKADAPVALADGPVGAARGLQIQFAGEAQIVGTVYYGDNYFHEHNEQAMEAVLDAVRTRQPQVLIAGPAFNAGRYGMSCVAICQAVATGLKIPCVTAMHEENPAIGAYRDHANPNVYCLPTATTAAGMAGALKALGKFALRLAGGEPIGPAKLEGYIPRGIRRLVKTERPGYQRAIDMLLKRMANEPCETEIPMEIWDDISPAPPLGDLPRRKIAVVTTSGVVPWGNPDRFKTFRNTFWKKYNIAEVKELEPGKWEAVHGGYNVAYMNQNPHYGVPLDALRSLEADGRIGPGKLYPAYYVIPGNQGSPAVMRRMGEEIAADLKQDGVEGVLFVAT